ncbi:hypothetical protein OG900_01700 [Streptomyces sp. NBC_00433]
MDADSNSKRGLEQLTDFLLWNAEIEQARRQAAAFASHLTWLTTPQREDVERVYVADRIESSRAILRRNQDRAAELRSEYSARYQALKMRCVAAALGAVAVATGLAAAIVLVLT